MRLLGNLFQTLSLQHFHEIHYDDMSMWTEKKSNTLGVSKSCLHSILVALLFFSVYAECPGPNIDILNFLLGLKTVCTPVSLLSLVYNECAGTTFIYTQIEMSSGNHAHVCILADMHIQGRH